MFNIFIFTTVLLNAAPSEKQTKPKDALHQRSMDACVRAQPICTSLILSGCEQMIVKNGAPCRDDVMKAKSCSDITESVACNPHAPKVKKSTPVKR